MRVTIYDTETMAPLAGQLEKHEDGRYVFVFNSGEDYTIVGNTPITIDGKDYLSLSIEGGDYYLVTRQDWQRATAMIPCCCPRCGTDITQGAPSEQGFAFVSEPLPWQPGQSNLVRRSTAVSTGYRYHCGMCGLNFVMF